MVLKSIVGIGEEVRGILQVDDSYVVEKLVNSINKADIEKTYSIDVLENSELVIKNELFTQESITKALFFQAGRGMKGGGIRGDFYPLKDLEKFENNKKYKKEYEENLKKFKGKIKSSCEYCGVIDRLEEIEAKILDELERNGNKTFIIIKVNGKYPVEFLKEKFLDDFYKVDFKRVSGKNDCHLCDKKGVVCHSTTTYKFYTNDKDSYSCLEDKEKWGIVICKECLDNIIIGKDFVEKKMTTYWLDSEVMFIPHYFNEEIFDIYNGENLDDDIINKVKSSEEDMLDELGKIDAETDIVFFEKDANKTFYIHQTIKSMLPSRFTKLSKLMRKYSTDKSKFYLWSLLYDISVLKIGKTGKYEPVRSEKLRYLENIFKGEKINRIVFFYRAMKKYKEKYYGNEKNFAIHNIAKNYNFLVDCGCLEGGFDCMKEYSGYNELFNENKNYFDSNEKKAWFILGNIYNYVSYKIKAKNTDSEGKIAGKSSLDKNFFFAKKFDFKDFIAFSNLLSEKIVKHSLNGKYLNEKMSGIKDLMGNRENKLSKDEAKYLFFWGMDAYFKKEESVNTDALKNGEGV